MIAFFTFIWIAVWICGLIFDDRPLGMSKATFVARQGFYSLAGLVGVVGFVALCAIIFIFLLI
jgi:hypothetical protein